MIEKIKAVNNPLTIIAIFAGIAEISLTTALALVEKSLQNTFIWFVMGFPILLIVLFFVTLNFNTKVLYSPGDYKDEDNFLRALIGTNKISNNLDQIDEQLDEAKKQIIQQSVEQIKSVGKQEKEKLTKIIDEQLKGVSNNLESVRIDAESVISNYTDFSEYKILKFLASAGTPQTSDRIAKYLNIKRIAIVYKLRNLVERELITKQKIDSRVVYSLNIKK